MKYFGTTIHETREAFLGAKRGSVSSQTKLRATVRIVMSFFLAVIATFFVLVDIGASQHIAEFIFGGLVGYWIK